MIKISRLWRDSVVILCTMLLGLSLLWAASTSNPLGFFLGLFFLGITIAVMAVPTGALSRNRTDRYYY